MNIRTALAALLIGLSAIGAVAGPAEATRPIVSDEPAAVSCDDTNLQVRDFKVRLLHSEIVYGRRPLPIAPVIATLFVATDYSSTVCGRVAYKRALLDENDTYRVRLIHKTGHGTEKFGTWTNNIPWTPTDIKPGTCTRTQARVVHTDSETGAVTRYASKWAITGLCVTR